MALTPDEIADKEFTFGLRGYDQDEVRAYLHLVAAAFSEHARDAADAAGTEISESTASSNAKVLLQKAHDEAVEIRQSATAEAEMVRARARAILSAAQEESLRLVAEAHARIDRRTIGAGGTAPQGGGPGGTVERLGEEISAMVQARDEVLRQLHDVKARLDHAVEAAEADPVLGRAAAVQGS